MDKKDKKTRAQELAEKMEAQRVGRAAFEAGKRPVNNTENAADLQQNVENAADLQQEPQEVEQDGISTPEDEKAAVEQETAKNEEPEQVTEAQEQDIISTFLDIEPEKREERETYSVHTTVAVRKELDKRAKQAKMSRGAYLDKLLKRAFGIS